MVGGPKHKSDSAHSRLQPHRFKMFCLTRPLTEWRQASNTITVLENAPRTNLDIWRLSHRRLFRTVTPGRNMFGSGRAPRTHVRESQAQKPSQNSALAVAMPPLGKHRQRCRQRCRKTLNKTQENITKNTIGKRFTWVHLNSPETTLSPEFTQTRVLNRALVKLSRGVYPPPEARYCCCRGGEPSPQKLNWGATSWRQTELLLLRGGLTPPLPLASCTHKPLHIRSQPKTPATPTEIAVAVEGGVPDPVVKKNRTTEKKIAWRSLLAQGGALKKKERLKRK